mgnify:CR=1 FL=1
MKPFLGNVLWMLSSISASRRFRRARRNPRRTQEEILGTFLRNNAGSDYGQKYDYASIASVEEFQKRVPVVTYEELEPWIHRIIEGEQGVLTSEPVLMLEKTSGSSGPAKYIPYTASLRSEFQNAVGVWMYDLYRNHKGLYGGRQYWSISPAMQDREVTPGGLPIGFEEDVEYLSPLAQKVVRSVMAVPSSVARAPYMEACRKSTMEALVQCRDLRVLSVWNPSFLTTLMGHLPAGKQPVDLWPKLAMISCWTDGAASRFLPDLENLFPGVPVQGKGLLATEGVVSVPLAGSCAPVPAITSHFLEFIEDGERARLVDELEEGKKYTVVQTTGGGFARYSLDDQVEVVAPGAIRFVGRNGQVSDLCGEKLSEAFVGATFQKMGLPGFVMLAPQWDRPPRYNLFVETDHPEEIAAKVEDHLRKSFHYNYCRNLGQLGPVRGIRVTEGDRRYLAGCEALGQKAGDVKPAHLRQELGWLERLEGSHAH